MYIFISVAAHEHFKRDGNNVLLEREISMVEAALGVRLTVPTLEGEREIQVKPGTQTGDAIRIKGLGFPNLRGFGRGSQIVYMRAVTPKKLSSKQRKLLEEFSKLED